MVNKALLCAMAVGTVLVIWLGASHRAAPPPAAQESPYEAPTLSREAEAQLVRGDGGPGPLFDALTLGAVVAPDARARVAQFAQQNHVEIDLDTADGELVAIHVGVQFRGGFGYENADTFALRVHRPHTGWCTGPDTWRDDWAWARDDGIHVRGRVRVNRVDIVWEQVATVAELLARASDLVGKDVAAVRPRTRGRWIELEPHRFVVEAPMPFPRYPTDMRYVDDGDFGIRLAAHAGHVVEASFDLEDANDDLPAAMAARWGKPRVDEAAGTSTWWTSDRTITLHADFPTSRVTITAR